MSKDSKKIIGETERPMKKKHTLLIILILLLAVVAVEAGIFLAITKNRTEPEDNQEFQAYYTDFSREDVVFENNTLYVNSRLLLTATEDASYRQIEKLAKKADGAIIGYISISNDYQIGFDHATYEQLQEKIEQLQKSKLVSSVGLEIVTKTTGATVNYKSDPWQATGSSDKSGKKWCNIDGSNWGVESILMPQVWDNPDFTFNDVNIGIIDSYFDSTCTELSNKFAQIYNQNEINVSELYTTPKEGHPDEAGDWISADQQNAILAHGSHTSGIIAAENNTTGITGISQNARLYGYSLSSDENDYQFTDLMYMKYAIACLLNNNVKAINLSVAYAEEQVFAILQASTAKDSRVSFLVDEYEKEVQSMEEFLRRCLQKYDFLIVNSAGNMSNNKNYYVRTNIDRNHPYGYRTVWYDKDHPDIEPVSKEERLSTDEVDARYNYYFPGIKDENVRNHILIVGSYDYDKKSKTFSKSSFSDSGDCVDIYAPGGYLKKKGDCTDIRILSSFPNNEIAYMQGTSMSAPMVTGVAALIWGINKDFPADQVRKIILDASEQFDSGRRLNAFRAVENAAKIYGPLKNTDSKSSILILHLLQENEEPCDISDINGKPEFHIYDESGNDIEFVQEDDCIWCVTDAGTYTFTSHISGYEDCNETIVLAKNETKLQDIILHKVIVEEEEEVVEPEEPEEVPEVEDIPAGNAIWPHFSGTWETWGQKPYGIRYTFDENYRYAYQCDTPGDYHYSGKDPVTYQTTDYGYYVTVYTANGTGGYRLNYEQPETMECIGNGDPYSNDGYSGTSSLERILE